MNSKICRMRSCDKSHHAKSMCASHYKNDWQRKNIEKRQQHLEKYNLSGKRLKTQRKYWGSTRYRWNVLRSSAKSRGHKISISYETYCTLIKDNKCFYCSGKLSPTSGGLDRKDSSKGYTKSNVEACCTICNIVKHRYITPKEMIEVVSLLKKLRNTDIIWEGNI